MEQGVLSPVYFMFFLVLVLLGELYQTGRNALQTGAVPAVLHLHFFPPGDICCVYSVLSCIAS